MISFILRQITISGNKIELKLKVYLLQKTYFVDNQHLSSTNDAQLQNFVPNQAREKWIKKRTSVKTRNGAANHRGNDVIVLEGRDQVDNQIFSVKSIKYFLGDSWQI